MVLGNLLIVDDEPILVKALRLNLSSCADQIFTASDGLEALDVISKEQIHCVICDINMPRMSGLELIKKVREDNNTIPFIFFTGHGNHEMMLEVAKYGAFDFFNKPNFKGLEESITRGLKSGFATPDETISEIDLLSDYQKMLLNLND